MVHSLIHGKTRPVTATERIHAVDVLRGIALFGVLAVNLLQEFRVSLFQQFLPFQPPLPPLDRTIEYVVATFVEMKAFALFSILFGVGLAIQSDRLARSGSRRRLLVRRLAVLLLIGLVHLLLIWNGDILTEYALVGFMALPFLSMSDRRVALAAVGLLALYVVMPALPSPIPWPTAAWLQHHVLEADHVYAMGTYREIVRFSWNELPYLLPLHEYVLPRTLGLFMVGILAWRSGVLTQPHRHRSLLLIVAGSGLIAGTLMGTPGWLQAITPWTVTAVGWSCLANASGILMALGYGSAVIALVEFTAAKRVLRVFAPLGRMAFTNYLLQSVIFAEIFFGYGLGYFGRLGVAEALCLGITVYACQAAFSAVWLRRYRFGPIEWLWRTLMYGVRQPMIASTQHKG